jgi:hypothetical protein
MVSTPALYLAVMAEAVPGQEAVSSEELQRIVGHLIRHQEADGSWSWASAPARNRPPPVFESDEVATLIASLALESAVPPDAKEASVLRDSREKAAAWLEKTDAGDSTQAAVLRLLVKARAGVSRKALQREIDQFLGRQHRDGGWSQTGDLASDAYATGQALYFLGLVGLKQDRTAIRRGVAFLVARQQEDGSWPMQPRAHPGATPATNPVPIVYFGSAWATLGLMRSVPRAPDRAGISPLVGGHSYSGSASPCTGT